MFNIPVPAYPPHASAGFNFSPTIGLFGTGVHQIQLTSVSPTGWGIRWSSTMDGGTWHNAGLLPGGGIDIGTFDADVFGTDSMNIAFYNIGTGVLNPNYTTYTWDHT